MLNNIYIKIEITSFKYYDLYIESRSLIQKQHNNYPINIIKECLKITDLVEFAKSNATENDFKTIISLFDKLINKQNNNKS